MVFDGEWLLVGGHSAIQEKASLLLELRPIASVPQDLYVILALPCDIERREHRLEQWFAPALLPVENFIYLVAARLIELAQRVYPFIRK